MDETTLVGREGVIWTRVTAERSADRYGNAGFDVLATPALVGLFEEAALQALDPALPEGSRSVGSAIAVIHRAATPTGMDVEVRARIVGVDGREVRFELEASDAVEPIGSGTHTRFIVDLDRFLRRTAAKADRPAGTDGGT
jgi:fluoroacetyl-CoA thioesterase